MRRCTFDQRTIVLPDVLAQSSVAPEQALKPVFDFVGQAAGFAGPRNYNAAGVWAPRRRWLRFVSPGARQLEHLGELPLADGFGHGLTGERTVLAHHEDELPRRVIAR